MCGGSSFQRTWRSDFIKNFRCPRCDIGVNIGKGGPLPKKYEKLSSNQQLKFKFIFSIEGADVATNLKWIAQSNSLCFMKKPKHESWFMEDTLIPNYHYIEINKDFENLDCKIEYLSENIDEAKGIIKNFQSHYSQFKESVMKFQYPPCCCKFSF